MSARIAACIASTLPSSFWMCCNKFSSFMGLSFLTDGCVDFHRIGLGRPAHAATAAANLET